MPMGWSVTGSARFPNCGYNRFFQRVRWPLKTVRNE